ncbi:MAG: acyltransferase 3 [Alphaproteobacteria bacterium]|nr:acyltransferase 3 [Alphaproteobacteria bacterium]
MGREVLHNLQVARFVAASGVLIHHSSDIFFYGGSLDAPPLFGIRWDCGVDIFFVISGFIMAYLTAGRFGDPGAPRSFLARRLIRIAPPYWIFTTLLIVTAVVLAGHVRNATLAAPQVVTSYVFLPWPRADGQLNPLLSQGWTLNYEAFFYVAFAAALFFRRGLIWLTLGFILLVALHPLMPPRAFMLHFWSEPIILEFLAGIGVALFYLRGRRLPWWAAAGCVAAGLIVAAAPRLVDAGMFGRLLVKGIPGLLICGGFVLAPELRRPGRIAHALRLGGDASYALYLSHTFTINATSLLCRHVGLRSPWAGFALAIVLAVTASILFYKIVERPLTNGLQRFFGTRPIEGAATVAP